jgi:maleylpyruvate isomerase
MTRTDVIAVLAESHATLIDALATELDPAAPSRLPGWSVGHVMTHLARNADSVVRRLDGAAAGTVVDQYPGGTTQRTQDIEAGAGRSWVELVNDVTISARAIDRVASALPDEAWPRLSRSSGGEIQDVTTVLARRIREVVIHQFDLGLGSVPSTWPDLLVDDLLDELVPTLISRCDRRELAAWLTGRGDAPRLEPF